MPLEWVGSNDKGLYNANAGDVYHNRRSLVASSCGDYTCAGYSFRRHASGQTELSAINLDMPSLSPCRYLNIKHRYPLSWLGNERKEGQKNEEVPRRCLVTQ